MEGESGVTIIRLEMMCPYEGNHITQAFYDPKTGSTTCPQCKQDIGIRPPMPTTDLLSDFNALVS